MSVQKFVSTIPGFPNEYSSKPACFSIFKCNCFEEYYSIIPITADILQPIMEQTKNVTIN